MRFIYKVLIVVVVLGVLGIIFKNNIINYFQSSSNLSNFLSIAGTIITTGSFLFALWESAERQKIEEKRKSQLWSSIDRARFAILDHQKLKDIDNELQHEDRIQLFIKYQASCDLYISLVEQYLSLIKKFTYKDLENLHKNGAFFWKWQERQWRILISQRKENKDEIPPDFFIQDSNQISSYFTVGDGFKYRY